MGNEPGITNNMSRIFDYFFSGVGVPIALPLSYLRQINCVCKAGNAAGIPTTESEGIRLAWRILSAW
jgi:hypothetical protein